MLTRNRLLTVLVLIACCLVCGCKQSTLREWQNAFEEAGRQMQRQQYRNSNHYSDDYYRRQRMREYDKRHGYSSYEERRSYDRMREEERLHRQRMRDQERRYQQRLDDMYTRRYIDALQMEKEHRRRLEEERRRGGNRSRTRY